MIEKVAPVTVDPNSATQNIQQYLPDILGAVFFTVIAVLIWKFLPKPLIGVLLVLAVVLLFAFHGRA